MSEFLEGSLYERVGRESLSKIENYAKGSLTNFNMRCDFLGLNGTKDFMYADLSGVDFSDSDLRNFNFTGSDLRGSYGTNTIIDESTVFRNSDVSGSSFEFKVQMATWIKDDPLMKLDLSRVDREDDADQLVYVHNLARRSDLNTRRRGLRLAKILFTSAPGLVARNNMLYCIRAYSSGDLENKAFIIHLLSSSINSELLKSALTIAGRIYGGDQVIRNLLTKYVYYPDALVRHEVLRPLVVHSGIEELQVSIIPIILELDDISLRSFAVTKLSERLNLAQYVPNNSDNLFDFRKPVKLEQVEYASMKAARAIGAQRLRDDGRIDLLNYEPSDSQIDIARKKVVLFLKTIKTLGIPVDIESN